MAEVLGRVVQVELESPRGPDATHRIRVPKDWLEDGATIELELPRHLTCRACDGGGCDVCERSGAVTLRGRGEPPDLVELNLPTRTQGRSFVIRIPQRGGLAHPDSGLPRGQLFVKIEAARDASTSVARVVPEVVALRRKLDQPLAAKRLPRWFIPAAIAAGLALAELAWLLLHSR